MKKFLLEHKPAIMQIAGLCVYGALMVGVATLAITSISHQIAFDVEAMRGLRYVQLFAACNVVFSCGLALGLILWYSYQETYNVAQDDEDDKDDDKDEEDYPIEN